MTTFGGEPETADCLDNVKSNRIQKIKASVKFRGFYLRDMKYEILFFDGCYKIKIITFNIGSN